MVQRFRSMRVKVGSVILGLGLLLLASPLLVDAAQSWTYMRRVGANNTNPGCRSDGTNNNLSDRPYCQDGGKFWAGYSVYNYPTYGEAERDIYAGTQDTAIDGGLWWGSTKATQVNTGMANYPSVYPAIDLDEQKAGGGFQTGLDAQWIHSSLPNPQPQISDDNGDGRHEEARVWAGSSSIVANMRYYAYVYYYDPTATGCCNPTGVNGEINYSAYSVYFNGIHTVDGIRNLGKFIFTGSFAPTFQCVQGQTYPSGCVQ